MPKSAKNGPSKKNSKPEENKKRWFKEFKAELKKIVWPSKAELLENSVVVISMVVIVAVIIFVLDLAFKELNNVEVETAKKIKNAVVVSENVNEDNSTSEANNDTTEESTSESETNLDSAVETTWENEETPAE